jgi:uncharacterized peroxidase-related enzyme
MEFCLARCTFHLPQVHEEFPMTSRINPVDVATAHGRTQELFGAIKAKMGRVPNMMKTMAQAPAVLEGYLALSGALSKGVLTADVREQIALAVSQVHGCEYCLSAHTLTGRLAGLTPDQIVAARYGEADDHRAQAVLNLTHAILEHQGDVSDEQLADAREAGLGDAEIAEVVGHVALNTLTNYFNQLAQTDVDWPHVSVGLPEYEYQLA